MNFTEQTFESWANGPGKTEADKCDNAESVVRKAIAADKTLNALDITVFPQGSYRARTNVREDSDVDICVRYNGTFFGEYPRGKTKEDFGMISSDFKYAAFKQMVGTALRGYFGKDGVTPGNKAFDVHANTYRIDADVVAAFEHRRYTGSLNSDGSAHYFSGIAFIPDSGGLIKNWPDQNYENGVGKNTACNRHYKRVVRILKRVCYKMRAEGVAGTDGIASFLIESLVWNTPDTAFLHDTYTEDVRSVIIHAFHKTKTDEDCKYLFEVNRLKPLLLGDQSWTRQQVNTFLKAVWNYLGYK